MPKSELLNYPFPDRRLSDFCPKSVQKNTFTFKTEKAGSFWLFMIIKIFLIPNGLAFCPKFGYNKCPKTERPKSELNPSDFDCSVILQCLGMELKSSHQNPNVFGFRTLTTCFIA